MYDTVPWGHDSFVCRETADGDRQCSTSRYSAHALRHTTASPRLSVIAPLPGQCGSRSRAQPLGWHAGLEGRMDTAVLYENRLRS